MKIYMVDGHSAPLPSLYGHLCVAALKLSFVYTMIKYSWRKIAVEAVHIIPHKLIAKSIMSPHENTNTDVQWELTNSRTQRIEWQQPRLVSTPNARLLTESHMHVQPPDERCGFGGSIDWHSSARPSIISLASESAPPRKLSGRKIRKNTASEGFTGERPLQRSTNKYYYPQIISPLLAVHFHKVNHHNVFFFFFFAMLCLWGTGKGRTAKTEEAAWRWWW